MKALIPDIGKNVNHKKEKVRDDEIKRLMFLFMLK